MLVLLLALTAHAGPHDPGAYTSLYGDLEHDGQVIVNTDTLGWGGGVLLQGVVSADGAAVFTFDNLTLTGSEIFVTGSRPLVLLAKQDMVLDGVLFDMSGSGQTAGPGGYDGGSGTGNGSGPGGGRFRGGGGGFGSAGSAGNTFPDAGAGGTTYGDLRVRIQGGSGGAPVAAGQGGGGGGGLELGAYGMSIVSSTLAADGASPLDGGAGAGGGVFLHAEQLLFLDTTTSVSATGGTARVGGGAGGGGRVVLAAPFVNNLATITTGGGELYTTNDVDGDGAPDLSDCFPYDGTRAETLVDTDVDGICDLDPADTCTGDDTTGDDDGDGICGDRDMCTGDDALGDTDVDGVCDDLDACDGDDASGDADSDGVCDDLDACTGDDALGDTDSDGVCDDLDACDGDDATGDSDGDGTCDDLDPCYGTGPDSDLDGVCDDVDACVGDDATGDTDGDGTCDDADPCLGTGADTDLDGVCDEVDVASPWVSVTVDTDSHYGDAVVLVDVDADGDLDLVVPTRGEGLSTDSIYWYENIGVAYGPATLLVGTGDTPANLDFADVDGDGDLDLVVALILDDQVLLYVNEAGPGVPSYAEPVVLLDVWHPRDFEIVDLFGDGYPEVLVTSFDDSVMGYLPNDGGVFGSLVNVWDRRAYETFAEDVDGDGILDLVATHVYGLAVAYGDGTGFGVASNLQSGRGTTAVFHDFDGDGGLDLVRERVEDRIVYHPSDVGLSADFTWRVDAVTTASAVGVLDADADGYDDLLWLDGGQGVLVQRGSAAGLTWEQLELASEADIDEAAIGDLDGDGDDDVVFLAGGSVVWLMNPAASPCVGDPLAGDLDVDGICDDVDACFGDNDAGNDDGDGYCNDTDPCTSADHTDTDADGVCDADDACDGDDATGDIDGDGTCDDIDPCHGTGADTDGDGVCDEVDVAWPWSRLTLDTNPKYSDSVVLVDVDTDGDLDVVVPTRRQTFTTDTITWYENLGVGFGPATALVATGGIPANLDFGDVDGDGDLDLVVALLNDDQVVLYVNEAGTGVPTYAAPVVLASLLNPRDFEIVDLFGDGYPEVTVTSFDDFVMGYLPNDEGVFGSLVNVWDRRAYETFAEDVDGDGILDLVGTHLYGLAVAYGDGTGFGVASNLQSGRGTTAVFHDFDGDGSLDLARERVEDRIVYHPSELGLSADATWRVDAVTTASAVGVLDADADGYDDLLWLDGGQGVLVQRGSAAGLTWEQLQLASDADIDRAAIGDLDGDGDDDVIVLVDGSLVWLMNPAASPCLGDPTFGDADLDGICDDLDLCTAVDARACDLDADGCLDDVDGDELSDCEDACPFVDGRACDGDGDGCLDDADVDGVSDCDDLCPAETASSCDLDEDGCLDDADGDLRTDCEDSCPAEDATLCDTDGDGCLDDGDGDAVVDCADSCLTEDASACDLDGDGCLDDADGDQLPDCTDACPTQDATGCDVDGDGCLDDADVDGLPDCVDACPTENPGTCDADGNGCFDDSDVDGICDGDGDLCFGDDASGDSDSDGTCDDLDACPLDDPDDANGDGYCDSDFVLTSSEVAPGELLALDVTGAPPNAWVYFVVSLRGDGGGPCGTTATGATLCTDLRQPTFLGRARADANGAVSFTGRAPRALPVGRTVSFQALNVVGDGDKTPVHVEVSVAAP